MEMTMVEIDSIVSGMACRADEALAVIGCAEHDLDVMAEHMTIPGLEVTRSLVSAACFLLSEIEKGYENWAAIFEKVAESKRSS